METNDRDCVKSVDSSVIRENTLMPSHSLMINITTPLPSLLLIYM